MAHGKDYNAKQMSLEQDVGLRLWAASAPFCQALCCDLSTACCSIIVAAAVLIVYAGETDEQHQELVQFCRDFPFQRMGAFTYSEEDGTPAASYQDQVSFVQLPVTIICDLTV